MKPKAARRRGGWGLLFTAVERATLFLLSLLIGAVDLAIVLFVAGRLGIIPKKNVDRAFRAIEKVPFVGRLFTAEPEAAKGKPRPAAAPAQTPR